MRKVAEIGVQEKIDAVHATRDTPCARHNKTFDPSVGKDGESDGVVNKVGWRNGMHEQLQLGLGILSRWLIPLDWRQIRLSGVLQVEKQNVMTVIA